MIVINLCEKHRVPLVGFIKPFCKYCRKDTEGNKEGQQMYSLNRTYLADKVPGETIEIHGNVTGSMTYNSPNRITVSDVLVGQQKVRITLTTPELMREFSTAKTVVLTGIVRHNMQHKDEVCDDLLVVKLQDIT